VTGAYGKVYGMLTASDNHLQNTTGLWACFMVDCTRECWHHGEPRIGAMVYRHHEREPHDSHPNPFPHLGVMTPGGLICLECPTSNEPYTKWLVEGEPPVITVQPSLLVGLPVVWHGRIVHGMIKTVKLAVAS